MERVIYYSVIPDGTWLTIRAYAIAGGIGGVKPFLFTLEKTRKQVGLKPYHKVATDYLAENYTDCKYVNID
jgi:hypothetical protein